MNTNSSATESGSTLKVFTYEDNAITFQLGNGDVMVNLTEMAKPFKALPADFLRLDQTKQFVDVLGESLIMGNPIIKTDPGRYGGTWAHQKLALKFAAWLNPRFELWVYDRIEELMRHGITATPQKIEEMLTDPDVMIQALTQLKNERLLRQQAEQRAQLASEQLQITETVVKQQAPKVQYYDRVMQSTDVFAIDVIASDLGLTAVKLNRFLAERGVQYKQQGCWVLTAKYRNQGLTRTKTHTFDRSNGEKGSSQHMYWTEKGKEFIYRLYSTATNAKSIK